jgi:hypothetical protein
MVDRPCFHADIFVDCDSEETEFICAAGPIEAEANDSERAGTDNVGTGVPPHTMVVVAEE